jgi:glycosyltransferase involved in cell wall biosynthesis
MISIVIGTYNQALVLERVLNEYTRQTLSQDLFEVIVVDSGSTDGTAELFQRFKSQFKFKAIVQENQGKSGARNRGVAEAQGTYIIITDADMIPDINFVKTHYMAQIQSVTPTCFEGVTMNMTSLHWPIAHDVLYPYIQKKYADGAKLGWYYFLTGNLSIPKALFNEMNGFDMEFQGYGWEDLELGYRLRLKKVPLLYLKEAINYHYHVVSERDEIKRNIKKGESAQIFLKKHPELKWFLGLNPLSVFVFKRIDPNGAWLKRMEGWLDMGGVRQRFSMWFLKEYYYLVGMIQN